MLEAYEEIDYSYPSQIATEVFTTDDVSMLDREMRESVDIKASKAITLVVDSGASKLLLPTNEGLKSVEKANGRVTHANSAEGLLETKGILDVNGNNVAGYVSSKLKEGLLA